MDTVFMNSENSKTSEPNALIPQLTDKLVLTRGEKSKHLLHREKHKTWYNNNEFRISATTWNDKFELPDGLYSVSDIQDYFEYI